MSKQDFELLENNPGKKTLLLGNEAIIRGAMESGLQFVTTYPGTPASEIGDIFAKIAREAGVYFEFSTNEKVAMETGAGASFCNLRTLVAMKHFGLNVATDFFLPLIYSGVKGGMVVVIADDPSCWSSAQSEENTRGFAYLSHVPILEPSDSQECKDFTKFAFELSEQFKIPVMVRETTRVSHQKMPVILDKIVKGNREGQFIKDPRQFSTMPPRVLEMHQELLEKIEKIRAVSEKSKLNKINNENIKSNIGVITSGVSYLYVNEALEELNIKMPILKLGFFHPLPKEKIKKFLKKFKKVLIVEELDPYLEKEIKILAKEVNSKLEVLGKKYLPEVGELKPEYVISALAQITGKKTSFDFKKHLEKFKKVELAKRTPQLCPGCPYWLVFSTVKAAAPAGTIFGGEIGCYMLAAYPPHQIQDYVFAMGSSISLAHGIKKATSSFAQGYERSKKTSADKQKLITFIGDGSFFHAGMPALVNTVYNKSNPLIIILENSTTAMTGQQPHPAAPKDNHGLNIEEIVKSFGVKNLKVIDPVKSEELKETIKEFLNKDEVSVIIARHPCVRILKKTII